MHYDFFCNCNTISVVVPDSRIFLSVSVQSFPLTDFSENFVVSLSGDCGANG